MDIHANAALGPAGRLALVEAIESGMSLRAAAAALNVRRRPRTAGGTAVKRRAPRNSPRALGSVIALRVRIASPVVSAPSRRQPILRARRETGLGPGRLAGICRRARSTIWKVLHRNGLSRRPRSPRESCRRYEWSSPGALLHVDRPPGSLWAPGHRGHRRSHGDQREQRRQLGLRLPALIRRRPLRYAYVEAAPDEGRGDSSGLYWSGRSQHLKELGLESPEAVMSDNGILYRIRRFQGRARARRSPADIHPALHAALERQGRALLPDAQSEWAYAHSWPSSTERSSAMSSFLRYYNRRRPHSSLGDRPPISRVHNVRGQDS